MYINNCADVRNSRFLSNLDKIAKEFGFQSCYAEIKEPGIDGVYFLCGTDIQSYLGSDKDIKEVIQRNKKNDCFLTKIRIFELTGHDDFVTHQNIVLYLQNLELMNRIYKERDIELPKKMDFSSVINIRALYANIVNTKSPYKKAGLISQLEKEMKNNIISDNGKDEVGFVYDSGKGRLANFFRKHFTKHNSQVSLAHLTAVSANVNTISIKSKFKKSIIKELDKYPNILYFVSDTYGGKVKAKDNEGLGSKEANDTRKFTLSFSSLYKDEVLTTINKVLYPALYQQDADTLNKAYGDLIPFSVPSYEWENITSLLYANNIPFAYSEHRHDTLDLSLVVPQSYSNKLEAVLNRLAKEKENFRICAFPLFNSKHYSLSEQDNIFEQNDGTSSDFYKQIASLRDASYDGQEKTFFDDNQEKR